jgi:hypothetical protein
MLQSSRPQYEYSHIGNLNSYVDYIFWEQNSGEYRYLDLRWIKRKISEIWKACRTWEDHIKVDAKETWYEAVVYGIHLDPISGNSPVV